MRLYGWGVCPDTTRLAECCFWRGRKAAVYCCSSLWCVMTVAYAAWGEGRENQGPSCRRWYSHMLDIQWGHTQPQTFSSIWGVKKISGLTLLMLFICSCLILELPLKLRLLIFLHAEKWSGSRLYLHWDRSGEQLHSTKERALRGLVHGLHPPWAPAEGLPNAAAPTWSPFHEEATEGAAAGPPEPPPSFRFYPLPVQSKD